MSRHTSRTNPRGVPHAPTSHVQIVLPAPLSATLPRPHSFRRDTEPHRVDKWVPVARDSVPFSRRASASAAMPTYFHHSSTPPPVPRIPK
ncbi:hypothetical protein E4T56_gene16298 [Termitomyces sp. T112]|nr:hypothetical protein E4T56_gene16298 [Termitomyces sp. T112]